LKSSETHWLFGALGERMIKSGGKTIDIYLDLWIPVLESGWTS